MIEVNKGHCRLNGTIAELIAETSIAVDAVANVISEKEYSSKDRAVEFIIIAICNNIRNARKAEENRP